ncbi:hypothetical protein L3Y34_012632 [Caenorhabditis briggsae]|uniref:Uncharacterized protein n=2 Tax=Caenorhabditis briggsae TaxID=6238 RepID=A0AAE8ZZI7_CAEBR|nr:hypothetical protein L3Y34_012632 [Caenorhabditis briggsae]
MQPEQYGVLVQNLIDAKGTLGTYYDITQPGEKETRIGMRVISNRYDNAVMGERVLILLADLQEAIEILGQHNMFIFAAAFQQNTLIMSTTAAEQPVLEVLNQNADKPKKKFQVVPVPGEFTRGRWKVIDTRFGSAMGIFGNYPPEDEYKMISVVRNNVITVRKKFRRHPPLPEDATTKEADSIRVLQKSQPRLDQVPVTNQIKILIMDPETAAVTAQKLAANAVGVTEVVAPTSDITSSMSSVTLLDTDPAKMDETAKLANATSNTVVAIDNKIVQAMDLVKTHLTFAVREEVECLRSTITDLEERLNALREENRLLRENVSPDVLAFITANKQIVE